MQNRFIEVNAMAIITEYTLVICFYFLVYK